MPIDRFLLRLSKQADEVEFEECITLISNCYDYLPMQFTNGDSKNTVTNKAGTNEGSCKIFAFAQLNELNKEETLACFGKFYRHEVLGNPAGTDHANIRQFMLTGPDGIHFEGPALILALVAR
ncbi:MAG: HopJ type III effector protein [Pseudomonadales bacterium]